jgi:N-acyl homoserine lactone hydrolase
MIKRFWLAQCAYMTVPRRAIVANGGWGLVRLPMLFGILEHDELGPVVIDAPYGHEGPLNAGYMTGSVLLRTGFEFRQSWSVVGRLEELGFRAADVSTILMTHLHHDHTGAMKSLAHARFIVSRDEWESAVQHRGARALGSGYVRTDFGSLSRQMEIKDDIPHLADSSTGMDIFGDGSVEMFFLPGHSPGHCGFRLHMESGRSLFFCGDAAFTVAQIRGEEGLGLFPRTIATSLGGVEVSLRALRRHLRDNPEDTPITSHDFELGGQCIECGPVLFK